MMTMDDLDDDAWRAAMANRADRHWVYKREGLPCRVCGTNIVTGGDGRPEAVLVPVLPGIGADAE